MAVTDGQLIQKFIHFNGYGHKIESMSKKRINNMPKHVTLMDNGKYAVRIYSRVLKKIFHVGCYEFINDAASARDEWILKNPDKSKGCMPRGVAKLKDGFTANISFNNTTIHLGYFGTIKEAVKYRKEVLLGLL